MPTNDFVPFAIADGANVEDQADYIAAATTSTGYISGKASSAFFNKTWRQCAFVANAIAQVICDSLGVDALDDGDQAGFLANLKAALQSNSGFSRTITAGGSQPILATDRSVFVHQIIPAAITLELPAPPVINQEVTFYDDLGDADVHNITIDGNGNTIAGLATTVINVPYGAVTLRWNNAATAWRIKP